MYFVLRDKLNKTIFFKKFHSLMKLDDCVLWKIKLPFDSNWWIEQNSCSRIFKSNTDKGRGFYEYNTLLHIVTDFIIRQFPFCTTLIMIRTLIFSNLIVAIFAITEVNTYVLFTNEFFCISLILTLGFVFLGLFFSYLKLLSCLFFQNLKLIKNACSTMDVFSLTLNKIIPVQIKFTTQ